MGRPKGSKNFGRTPFNEDTWNQVKHCKVCYQPMLLVDWAKRYGRIAGRKDGWLGNIEEENRIGVAIREGKSICDDCSPSLYRSVLLEEKRVFVDNEFVRQKLIEIREYLGLNKSDTPSTYDGWDFMQLVWENMKIGGIQIEGPMQELFDYLNTTKYSSMMNFWEKRSRFGKYYKKPNHRQKSQDTRPVNISMFMWVIDQMFPNEVQSWPVWKLKRTSRQALKTYGVISDDSVQINEPSLFKKMVSEIYGGNPTFDDMKMLGSYNKYKEVLLREHPWLPAYPRLYIGGFEGQPDPLYESTWAFIKAFQEHVCDELIMTESDYKIVCDSNTRNGLYKEEITIEDGRHWFFNYLLPELDVYITVEDFPFNSSRSDLEQVINLTADEIYHIDGGVSRANKIAHAISKLYDPKTKTTLLGIKKIVELLWPEYEMEQNLWNRMLVGEKKMSRMLSNVLTHFGNDYKWDDKLQIPTRTGRVARYKHSKLPMRIDGISRELSFIVEGQGDYHYEGYGVGHHWKKTLPKCYEGNATTSLEYRQELDAKCKRAIKRHGFSPIYVVLSRFGKPVKGVHGDIPIWNRSYVSGSSNECIGLAETFDMQGREDIGDMIRDYHQNVVMKMTKEMKRKLEE